MLFLDIVQSTQNSPWSSRKPAERESLCGLQLMLLEVGKSRILLSHSMHTGKIHTKNLKLIFYLNNHFLEPLSSEQGFLWGGGGRNVYFFSSLKIYPGILWIIFTSQLPACYAVFSCSCQIKTKQKGNTLNSINTKSGHPQQALFLESV